MYLKAAIMNNGMAAISRWQRRRKPAAQYRSGVVAWRQRLAAWRISGIKISALKISMAAAYNRMAPAKAAIGNQWHRHQHSILKAANGGGRQWHQYENNGVSGVSAENESNVVAKAA